jgi:hypothetical protein
MPKTRSIEPFGAQQRNERLTSLANSIAHRFGKAGELYVNTRAETAERLGLYRRAREWRVIEGILRRLQMEKNS